MNAMVDFVKNLWDKHEYVFVSDWEGLIFAVDKVGGGTLHQEYVGDWTVTVYDGDGTRLRVGELSFNTMTPHTHVWAALSASGCKGGL